MKADHRFGGTCCICLERQYKGDDLMVAFRLAQGLYEPIEIRSTMPGLGVRVVCPKCREFLVNCPTQGAMRNSAILPRSVKHP